MAKDSVKAKLEVFTAYGNTARTGKYKSKAQVTIWLNNDNYITLSVKKAEKALQILTEAIAAAKGEKTNG